MPLIYPSLYYWLMLPQHRKETTHQYHNIRYINRTIRCELVQVLGLLGSDEILKESVSKVVRSCERLH